MGRLTDGWMNGLKDWWTDGWVGRHGRRDWQTKLQIYSWTFTEFILSRNNMAKLRHLHLIVGFLSPVNFEVFTEAWLRTRYFCAMTTRHRLIAPRSFESAYCLRNVCNRFLSDTRSYLRRTASLTTISYNNLSTPLRYMDKNNSNWFYMTLHLITRPVNHFLNYFTAWYDLCVAESCSCVNKEKQLCSTDTVTVLYRLVTWTTCNYARSEVFQTMLEYLGILGYDVVPIGKQIPPFWSRLLPPSSGSM